MKVNKVILFLLVLVTFIFLLGFIIMGNNSSDKNEQAYSGMSERLSILYFYSQDCISCSEQDKVWEDVSKSDFENMFNFIKINVKDPVNKDIVQFFGVTSTPTINIVSRENYTLYKSSVLHDKEQLEHAIRTSEEIEEQLLLEKDEKDDDNTIKSDNKVDNEEEPKKNEIDSNGNIIPPEERNNIEEDNEE